MLDPAFWVTRDGFVVRQQEQRHPSISMSQNYVSSRNFEYCKRATVLLSNQYQLFSSLFLGYRIRVVFVREDG